MSENFDVESLYKQLVEEEGFTICVSNLKKEKPNRGFIVALEQKYEIKLSMVLFAGSEVVALRLLRELLNTYLVWYTTKVREEYKNVVYIGAWFSRGFYHFDFSEMELDIDTALFKAVQRNQIAVYDIKSGVAHFTDRISKYALVDRLREQGKISELSSGNIAEDTVALCQKHTL